MSDYDIPVGITHELDLTVTAEHSPRHLAPTIVLSTPTMIGYMERVSTMALQPLLPEGHTSVGTHVDVSHESAARNGETVRFDAEITEVRGRRVTFSVVARVDDRIIGRGTHERAIIDRSRFGA